jgi:hypothetical protein
MNEIYKKRQAFIDAESKNIKTQDDLGNAIITSIHSVAKTKGYVVAN